MINPLKSRRGLSLLYFVVGLLLFGLFMSGMWYIYAAGAIAYNVQVNESFAEPFDKTLETKNLTSELAQNVQNTQATTTDSLITFISGGISSLKIIFNSVTIAASLYTVIQNWFGIPQFVVTTLVTIAMLAVLFAIVQALLNR